MVSQAAGLRPGIASHWWIFLIRGLIALAFGIYIVLNPALALLVFIVLFAAYAFADGVLALIGATQTSDHRIWLIIEGLIGIGIGVFAFLHPGIALPALGLAIAWMVAGWALATGILEIVFAIRLRNQVRNEFWMIVIGVLSVILGVILFLDPGLALATFVYIVAFYAFLAGISFIALAFRLKSLHDNAGAHA